MALLLTKENEEGFSFNYHRITSINILLDRTVVTVQSFKDELSKDSKRSCGDTVIVIPFSTISKANVNLANIYTELKRSKGEGEKVSGFEGAGDC